MDFTQVDSRQKWTIAAIATSIGGDGVIAMIRISGKEAAPIADQILTAPVLQAPSNVIKYAKVVDGEEVIDEVMFAFMKGPKTFTGEDTIEIHCHGGSIIPNKIMDLLQRKGAALARPGEFTMRAFLNGKLDLTQAEAIQQMIAAKNETAYRMAKSHLLGGLSEKIISFQKRLTELASIIEAWVDYPEEGLEFASHEEMVAGFQEIQKEMGALLQTFYDGRRLTNEMRLCLIGSPNVGKSSLLNTLLRKNRAIVTEIAGTTRDVVEDQLQIGPLSFLISDTAGLRETDERIESEGIQRSLNAAKEADIVIFMLESGREPSQEEAETTTSIDPEKLIVTWNKIDETYPSFRSAYPGSVCISAREEIGIEELKAKILEKAGAHKDPHSSEIFLTSRRHYEALSAAKEHLECALANLTGEVSAEFIAIDLKESLKALSSIVGGDVNEEILDSIFSKFCVGK